MNKKIETMNAALKKLFPDVLCEINESGLISVEDFDKGKVNNTVNEILKLAKGAFRISHSCDYDEDLGYMTVLEITGERQ